MLGLTRLCQAVGIAPLATPTTTTSAPATTTTETDAATATTTATAATTPTGLSRDHIHTVFHALLESSCDYSVDNRGDVGSWVGL